MTQADSAADTWLEDQLPGRSQVAAERARKLSAQLEYLAWPDRAAALDRYFWADANEQLEHANITSVINRQVLGSGEAKAVAAYAYRAKSVLTAALISLDERRTIGSIWQGLAWLLCRRPKEYQLASAWMHGVDETLLRAHLAKLPGFAFLMLAATQDDTTESFLARDAFWDAMLGETREAASLDDNRLI
jgi:hypothetical protein